MPLGSAEHRVACTAQPQGHTEMGQVFTLAHVGWSNTVQVRMLHRDDFRQKAFSTV